MVLNLWENFTKIWKNSKKKFFLMLTFLMKFYENFTETSSKFSVDTYVLSKYCAKIGWIFVSQEYKISSQTIP